jgi:hypothetical protein
MRLRRESGELREKQCRSAGRVAIRFHFRPVARRLIAPNRVNSLADRLQKLHPDQVHISSFLLTLYPGLDRRHSGRN